MKTSDEELDKLITWNYPANLYPLVNSALIDLRDLRKLARPFAGWNNCIQSDNEFRWFKVTAQEFDALKTHLEAKP